MAEGKEAFTMDSLFSGNITDRFGEFVRTQQELWRPDSPRLNLAAMASHGACYTEECPEESADCPEGTDDSSC